eukprot:2172545-Prymnesium_polylepis.1
MSTWLPVGGRGIPGSLESPRCTPSYSSSPSRSGSWGTLGVGVADEKGRLDSRASAILAPMCAGPPPPVSRPARIAPNAASWSTLRSRITSCSLSFCSWD